MGKVLERGVRDLVQAVIDVCANTGEDVRNKLREFKSHQRQHQAILNEMRAEMGKEPDEELARTTRLTELEIERRLLELERPKGEA